MNALEKSIAENYEKAFGCTNVRVKMIFGGFGGYDIWYTPAKPVECINLNFIQANSNATFDQVIGEYNEQRNC